MVLVAGCQAAGFLQCYATREAGCFRVGTPENTASFCRMQSLAERMARQSNHLYADPNFADEMRSLIPVYFNPVQTVHHYLALSAKALYDRKQDGTIAVKKLFYALSGLLATMWTAETKAMPPTPFVKLLNPEYVSAELFHEISRLQGTKARSTIKCRIPFPEILSDPGDFIGLHREGESKNST